MIEGIGVFDVLVVSTLMFFIGVYGFLVRKNLITILMSVELILNSVNINFNKYLYPDMLQGYMFSMFAIGIAAAEAAVAIAIILNVFRKMTSIDADNVDTMKY